MPLIIGNQAEFLAEYFPKLYKIKVNNVSFHEKSDNLGNTSGAATALIVPYMSLWYLHWCVDSRAILAPVVVCMIALTLGFLRSFKTKT